MATSFDRWEKDPFFQAAEEVQESTDRMESVYRRWINERQEASNSSKASNCEDSSGELCRDLQTALGTAKWQLQVLEKAVKTNDEACSAGEDTRTRRKDFFTVIGNQISKVEKSVALSTSENGMKVSWVQLDDGERDELALFLSRPPLPRQPKAVVSSELKQGWRQFTMNGGGECQNSKCNLNENGALGIEEEKKPGHRRTASANPGIGSWSISVSSEDEPLEKLALPLPKTASFSCLTKALEPASKVKWSSYGFRNWTGDRHHSSELIPLKNSSQVEDTNLRYDEYYNKQLHGWVGALNRQLQRSQYQIQYGRPIQMICCAMLILLFLVLVAIRAI